MYKLLVQLEKILELVYMAIPSFRKLEKDLEVNKTTLHNWKKNRPKLYEFIIESYKDKKESIVYG